MNISNLDVRYKVHRKLFCLTGAMVSGHFKRVMCKIMTIGNDTKSVSYNESSRNFVSNYVLLHLFFSL